MAAPKFLARILGIETSMSAIASGGGVPAAANQVLATNASGLLDNSFYTSSSSTGTGSNPNSSGVIKNDGSAPGNYVIS